MEVLFYVGTKLFKISFIGGYCVLRRTTFNQHVVSKIFNVGIKYVPKFALGFRINVI